MRYIVLLIFGLLSACSFRPPIGDELINQPQSYVSRRLGTPTIQRTEAPYRLWSYRVDSCSILVYLDKDDIVRYVDFAGDC